MPSFAAVSSAINGVLIIVVVVLASYIVHQNKGVSHSELNKCLKELKSDMVGNFTALLGATTGLPDVDGICDDGNACTIDRIIYDWDSPQTFYCPSNEKRDAAPAGTPCTDTCLVGAGACDEHKKCLGTCIGMCPTYEVSSCPNITFIGGLLSNNVTAEKSCQLKKCSYQLYFDVSVLAAYAELDASWNQYPEDTGNNGVITINTTSSLTTTIGNSTKNLLGMMADTNNADYMCQFCMSLISDTDPLKSCLKGIAFTVMESDINYQKFVYNAQTGWEVLGGSVNVVDSMACSYRFSCTDHADISGNLPPETFISTASPGDLLTTILSID